jgi:dihydrofolate synthase/folylpolyglutamate synthase
MFFLAARQAGVDWAILETGLGGRLDATNVLDPGPVLWTRIGLEHTEVLGRSIPAIAAEKAAILKPGGWAVLGNQDGTGAAEPVFAEQARVCGAPLYRAAELCPLLEQRLHLQGQDAVWRFASEALHCRLRLLGDFQAENLQNALAMLAALRAAGYVEAVPPTRIAAALERLELPGRMERFPGHPELILDGGHCPTAAAAVVRSLRAHFGRQPTLPIVGMMKDKDHDAFMSALAAGGLFHELWCYRAATPRAADPQRLVVAGAPYFKRVQVYPDLHAALESAAALAEKWDRVVLMGTIYSIDPGREWIHRFGI